MYANYAVLCELFYFYPEKYLFGVSSQSAGSDDVISFVELSPASSSHCVDGLALQHGNTYYVIVVAVNTAEQSTTSHSDGGIMTMALCFELNYHPKLVAKGHSKSAGDVCMIKSDYVGCCRYTYIYI